MQEYFPDVLSKSDKLYVDSIDKASKDGELHHALAEKTISKDKVTGELGDLILDRIPGRESSDEITFVDLVGLGIQDATATEYLLNKLSSRR